MKTSVTLLLAVALLLSSCAAESGEVNPDTSATGAQSPAAELTYDSLLAKELGADDYGMKAYVMAFLYRGEANGLDSLQRAELQRGHMENITRMAENGDLVLAGPFMGNGDLRGIYVFDVRTVEEAEALTNTDPAIQAGTLRMELQPWYGSAALMKVNELHVQIAKINI
ncbi:MAG: hypothetical protein HRU12_15750 [Phaeodactylibacter sp.]|nr:hypothetical protein [Phaeodactylibacter sp.]